MLKNLYLKLIAFGNGLQPFLLLAMRLYWGYSFFKSGWGKLHDIPSTADFFESLNIPLPLFHAYVVSYVEMVGGMSLLLGLAARLFAIPLIINMIVALLTAHIAVVENVWENPSDLIRASPFTYLLTSLIILAFGPGKISLDYLLEKFFQKDSVKPKPR